jgi:hypothetical protein
MRTDSLISELCAATCPYSRSRSIMAEDKPRSTGNMTTIDLRLLLIPWSKKDQAVFLSIVGSNDLYLPLFKNAKSLKEVLRRANVAWSSIKKVDDFMIFLSSLPEDLGDGTKLKIIHDVRYKPDGRILYNEISREQFRS